MTEQRFRCVACQEVIARPVPDDEVRDWFCGCADRDGSKIVYNHNHQYDFLLKRALIEERKLGRIFTHGCIEKWEVKGEQYQWEQTGKIAVEYSWNGKPSGIAATRADMWAHELKRAGKTLLYLMVPVDRLRELCREAYRNGDHRPGGKDKLSRLVLLRLGDLLK